MEVANPTAGLLLLTMTALDKLDGLACRRRGHGNNVPLIVPQIYNKHSDSFGAWAITVGWVASMRTNPTPTTSGFSVHRAFRGNSCCFPGIIGFLFSEFPVMFVLRVFVLFELFGLPADFQSEPEHVSRCGPLGAFLGLS